MEEASPTKIYSARRSNGAPYVVLPLIPESDDLGLMGPQLCAAMYLVSIKSRFQE